MKTDFRRVVIIGYGKATGEILKYTADRRADYGYTLEFIEHEPHALSVTKQICEERGIPFASVPDKRELGDYFGKIQEKTLIVSASNNFLFPAALVERKISRLSTFTMRSCRIIPEETRRVGLSIGVRRGRALPGTM